MRAKLKFIVLIIIVISIVFFIDRTSSRYISETNLSGTVSAAIPYLVLDANIPTQEMKPIEYSTFEFTLSNFVEDEVDGNTVTHISEIPMTYYIEIINKTEKDNNELRYSKKLCRDICIYI